MRFLSVEDVMYTSKKKDYGVIIFVAALMLVTIFAITVAFAGTIVSPTSASAAGLNVTSSNALTVTSSSSVITPEIESGYVYQYISSGNLNDKEDHAPTAYSYLPFDMTSGLPIAQALSSSSRCVGKVIIPSSDGYASIFGIPEDDTVMYMNSNPGTNTDFVFTFALSDEFKKALKDKMLAVTVTPYIHCSSPSTATQSNLSNDLTVPERCSLTLALYDETNNVKSVMSYKDGVSLTCANTTVYGKSSRLSSMQAGANSFMQVNLSNWVTGGNTFDVVIREVGVKIAIRPDDGITIAMDEQTGGPSSSPNDLNVTTTCLVQGSDRHKDAYSTNAKEGDVLDINLVLQTDSGKMTLDTTAYANYAAIDALSLSASKDGTMFRRLFLNETMDRFIINWSIAGGDATPALNESNMSGQAIKWVVRSGEATIEGDETEYLTLRPTISYRNPSGGLTAVGGGRLTINIMVDSYAPNSPEFDDTNKFYANYLDDDKKIYYTSVTNDESKKEVNNGTVMRFAVTGDSNTERPTITAASADLAHGSNTVIYYQTKFYGEDSPVTVAERNAEAFIGPVYYQTKDKNGNYTGLYDVFMGSFLDRNEPYYQLVQAELTAGSSISSSDNYFVRNNYGYFTKTTDTYVRENTVYYTVSAYNWANAGLQTGVYAYVKGEIVEYGDIYINLTTQENLTRMFGVWEIQLISYDVVGQNSMCLRKYFINIDISEYDFTLYYSGDDELYSDGKVTVTLKTVAPNGKTETVQPERVTSDVDDVDRDVFYLRRSDKILIELKFNDTTTYGSYKFTELKIGNLDIITTDLTYRSRATSIEYLTFTNTTDEESPYTFEVDSSYCSYKENRDMYFVFKNIVKIDVASANNRNVVTKIYNGESQEITAVVTALQNEGTRVEITTTYYMDEEMTQRVEVGASNLPVDAGTYYYNAEIVNHTVYYGQVSGTLSIQQCQPSLATLNENMRINYGSSLATLDYDKSIRSDPEDGFPNGKQLPSQGVNVIIEQNFREYFLTTTSSMTQVSNSARAIPGYYELVVTDKSSPDYVKPGAGKVLVKVRFTPVKGTVNYTAQGPKVTFEYDANGNFITDTNYEVVTKDVYVTVVPDDNVDFTVSNNQESGSGEVKTTTMENGVLTDEVKRVIYTYNSYERTVQYTITAVDDGETVDLKEFVLVSYASVSSMTLTRRQADAQSFVNTQPTSAGLYLMRVMLNESKRGCNYSGTFYVYIEIKKIVLTVTPDETTMRSDYQYEQIPYVELKIGIETYAGSVAKYDYVYYYNVNNDVDEDCVDENIVGENNLRPYLFTPINAGNYWAKISIVDPNYEGETIARYTINKVNTGNTRFSATWPSLNPGILNSEYNLTAGQPVSELNVGGNTLFRYSVRNVRSPTSTSYTAAPVEGVVYKVPYTFNDWLSRTGKSDTIETRKEYLTTAPEERASYAVNGYNWYLCFSAQTRDEEGEIVFNENFDFIYNSVFVTVGKADVDWSKVEISPVEYRGAFDWANTFINRTEPTTDNELNLTVTKKIAFLLSTSNNKHGLSDEECYVLNARYVYQYVTEEYTLDLDISEPNVRNAGTYFINIRALFDNRNDYSSYYTGNIELTIEKKELTITASDKETIYNAYSENDYYSENAFSYEGFVESDINEGLVVPANLTGLFAYYKDGERVNFGALKAGEYTVTYTLQHANYSGSVDFVLTIKKADLSVESAPILDETAVFYNANVKRSVNFFGGTFIATGGEAVRGNVTLLTDKYEIKTPSGFSEREIGDETVFPEAGTTIRLYYIFTPNDGNNYNAFTGTAENGGYVDYTVSKADVSDQMAANVDGNYIYKDITRSEADIRRVTTFTVPFDLACAVSLKDEKNEQVTYNDNYLNAGRYVVTISVEDDNYQGKVTCALTVAKKNAFVSLKESNSKIIEADDGTKGIRKAYTGSTKNIDYVVKEETNEGLKEIREAVEITYSLDGQVLRSAPNEIGFYDATIKLASANYIMTDYDSGEQIAEIDSFLMIAVDETEIELYNLEQTYTVQKTVFAFMGTNGISDEDFIVLFDKNGTLSEELPVEAGEYDVYVRFLPYKLNGYGETLKAADFTDKSGVKRGYKLVINRYYKEIVAPNEVTATYTGEPGEKFTPMTSPHGIELGYSYRKIGDNDWTESTLQNLGALNFGTYDVKITITDKNYRGEKTIRYNVIKARLNLKTAPTFGEYMYNNSVEPMYLGGGTYVFGDREVGGSFRISTNAIKDLPVGEHNATYTFTPDEENFTEATGTVRIKIIKRMLGQEFVLFSNNLLANGDHTVEYDEMSHALTTVIDYSMINNYPRENADVSVSVTYYRNDVPQTPNAIGRYSVRATVSSKNYTLTKNWTYELVITQGTPVIREKPFTVKTFTLGDTVTVADLYGGKATVFATGSEVPGRFDMTATTLNRANAFPVTVTFIPTDGENFKSTEFTINVNVIGKDPFTIDGETKATGTSAKGENLTDKVLAPTFETRTPVQTAIVNAEAGEHGAKIVVRPRSGAVSLEYGATLNDFILEFVPAHSGCADCNAKVNTLRNNGSLTFAESGSTVPNVGTPVEVVYSVTRDKVVDAELYNNLEGYIDFGDALVKKNLNWGNANFKLMSFDGLDDYALTVSEDDSDVFFTIDDRYGTISILGSIENTDDPILSIVLSVTLQGENEALVSFETKNYTAEEFIYVNKYRRLNPENIMVEHDFKFFDGNGISIEDIGISLSDTEFPIEKDAVTLVITENGEKTAGVHKGTYLVTINVSDDRNHVYGTRNFEFEVKNNNVSDNIALVKNYTVESGERVYYDSYNSGSHTILTPVLEDINVTLASAQYEVTIKKVGESDALYRRVNSLSAGRYNVKVRVYGDDFEGEKVFTYLVEPQRINAKTSSVTYTVTYGTSEWQTFAIGVSFTDETGDAFSFDDRGGYTVSYFSQTYSKSTVRPMNAGEYAVQIEANNSNYRIYYATITYTVRPKTTRMEVEPNVVAIDAAGNNLVYGQKLSNLQLDTSVAVVKDTSGNVIQGSFGVTDEDKDRVLYAGERTINIRFVPNDSNFETITYQKTIFVAKKVIKLEFESLNASYNGSSRKNELKYKAIEDPVTMIFTFRNATGQVVDPVSAGVYTVSVQTSDENYIADVSSAASGSGLRFTVNRATVNKAASVSPTAGTIGVGESLLKSVISGGRAYYNGFNEAIRGTYSYVEGGRTFKFTGTYNVQFLFTPEDNANFAAYTGEIPLTIGKGSATITAGENIITYGDKADFTKLNFSTLPQGLSSSVKYDLTCDGVTYYQGEILPAGTYWFKAWVDDDNYVSEPILFSYVVNKKEIDVDFLSADEVVTSYSVSYGEKVKLDVRLYDENVTGKRTYLVKDHASMKANVQYVFTSRAGTDEYNDFNAPSKIGTYDLTVNVIHDNYVATKTVIYRVVTGVVTDISFDLDTLAGQTYGNVVVPVVTTTPSNVKYYIVYQGYDRTLPTMVGSYNITVYIDDENYASKQVSAVFKINPKPITVTDIQVKDKAYDGVDSVEISAKLSGVNYSDEVSLVIAARTMNGATGVGEYYVDITECRITGLNASNYTLEKPKFDGKVRIYSSLVRDLNGSSYIISDVGFDAGTTVSFKEVNTSRNKTNIWSKMLGVESTVLQYSIKVNGVSEINANQYKVCVAIPEQYKGKNFKVEFTGDLANVTTGYTVEGDYVSFYSSTTSGELVFSTAEFKYGYVVTAAVLLLVLIAIIVLLILNPLQHRRKVSDPYAAKRAIKKIKKG